MLWLVALLAAAQQTGEADRAVGRMVALYDEVCLQAFPDDAAVDAVMEAQGARALTPEEVRVTFRNDPGRGWLLDDGDRNIQIMLELPPYHACSVRRTTDGGFGDLTAYEAVTARYKATHPGFATVDDQAMDREGIRIRMSGELRELPDGRTETLYLFDQTHADRPGVDIRFVHQIVAADAR